MTAPTTKKLVAIDRPIGGFPDVTSKEEPKNTIKNLEYLMSKYGITARYNVMTKSVELAIPGLDTTGSDNRANVELSSLVSQCELCGLSTSKTAEYVRVIADRNSYNPVADWILSKPWDKVSRLQDLLDTVTVEARHTGLKDSLIKRWLLSAVAAVFMEKGFESHGVLTMAGIQGVGKTSWFKRLCSTVEDAVLLGALIDPANKDSVTNGVSHWITEMGELDGTFRKADIARLKSFVTQPTDELRRPYDRLASKYRRKTVFCASVNQSKYLLDETGNRRWWTLPVLALNYTHTIDMQQLWAEVLALWAPDSGERTQHWLTKDESEALEALNDEHSAVDPVEEMLLHVFDFFPAQPPLGAAYLVDSRMTSSNVLKACGFENLNRLQSTHMAALLKKYTGKEGKKSNGNFVFDMPKHRPLLNDKM